MAPAGSNLHAGAHQSEKVSAPSRSSASIPPKSSDVLFVKIVVPEMKTVERSSPRAVVHDDELDGEIVAPGGEERRPSGHPHVAY